MGSNRLDSPYPLAFPNVEGPSFVLTEDHIQQGLKASRKSPRKRIILPIHRVQEAEVQRMLNFLQPGTYIRPHLHPLDHASESLMLIRGSLLFLLFNEVGHLQQSILLEAGKPHCMIDIEPKLWHSFLIKEPDTILFECKKGPYAKLEDKHFAPWAPKEETKEAEEWVREKTDLLMNR